MESLYCGNLSFELCLEVYFNEKLKVRRILVYTLRVLRMTVRQKHVTGNNLPNSTESTQISEKVIGNTFGNTTRK
jgi:hypothetical protein